MIVRCPGTDNVMAALPGWHGHNFVEVFFPSMAITLVHQ